jgi:hypothetical protein
MARMKRPRHVVVNFGGIDYDMDLAVVRHALVRRQVAGEFDSMEGLSKAIGRSRSTASRFVSGKSTSLPVALAVLAKLKLDFDEVFTPCNLDDGRARLDG